MKLALMAHCSLILLFIIVIIIIAEANMCGICFILGGAPISSHDFTNFNFFQSYLCKNNIPLN